MLGEMLSEEQGKITGIRVLPSEGQDPKMEVSFQASGRLLGVDETDMGTYEAVARPDGTLHGKGQGVIMTADGEVVTWTGEGVARPGRGLAASWRGAVYHQTASQKLARLNGVAIVFEYEVDESGNVHSKLWEWK